MTLGAHWKLSDNTDVNIARRNAAGDPIQVIDPASGRPLFRNPRTGAETTNEAGNNPIYEVNQETLYYKMQHHPLSVWSRMLDQSLPQFVQAAATFAKIDFVMEEAKQEYRKILAQTLKDMADRMYQSAQEQFGAQSQQVDAIKQFVEQFAAATTRILRGG